MDGSSAASGRILAASRRAPPGASAGVRASGRLCIAVATELDRAGALSFEEIAEVVA
jgi:hypothetical protein